MIKLTLDPGQSGGRGRRPAVRKPDRGVARATAESACSLCGAPLEAHFTRGALTAYSNPPRIYHRGAHLVLSPMQARIMLLLIRLGRVPFETLTHLSSVKSLQGIFVVTTDLRRRLPDGIRIVTARRWGYVLEQSLESEDTQ